MCPKSKPIPFFLLLPLVTAGLFSCAKEAHYSFSAYGFGTMWDIHLYEGEASVGEEIVSYINHASQVLDANKTMVSNGVYALNHQGFLEQADPLLLEAIALGQKAQNDSEGAFNLCLGSLTSAWLLALENDSVLDSAEATRLRIEAMATSITVRGESVSKNGDGKLDLGSIGKGLALRHIKALLDEKGIRGYYINGGTSSLLFGRNRSDDGATKVLLNDVAGRSFRAKDTSISVSSISRQKYVIDGKAYSHIIDGRSGSAEAPYDALILKGADPALADAYSTAYFHLGIEKVKTLEEQGFEVCLAKGGRTVYETPGFLS